VDIAQFPFATLCEFFAFFAANKNANRKEREELAKEYRVKSRSLHQCLLIDSV
jgi:hypothetical protein